MASKEVTEATQSQVDNTHNTESDIARCANCQTPLTGPYCGTCGQPAFSVIGYFGDVLKHIIEDTFGYDSRAARTLPSLLFKPGYLTNEYIRGRRVHFIPPLRLYLFISILFFLTINFFQSTTVNGIRVEPLTGNQVLQELNDIEENLVNRNIADGELSAQEQYLLELTQEYQQRIAATESESIRAIELKIYRLKAEIGMTQQNMTEGQKRELDVLNEVLDGMIKAYAKDHTSKEVEATAVEEPEEVKPSQDSTKYGEPTQSNSDDRIEFNFGFLSPDNNAMLSKKATELGKKADKQIKDDPRVLIEQALETVPQLMFILLPIFALLLKILYLFSNRYYTEHLTVALHSHSFIFLTIMLAMLNSNIADAIEYEFPKTSNLFGLISVALMIWLPIYLLLMQKRVYKQGKLITFIKYCLTAVGYSFLMMSFVVIAFIWGVLAI